MFIEFHDGFQKPQRIKATRVLICDDFGNPIGLFAAIRPGQIVAEIADNNSNFQKLLKMFGLDRTVLVDTVAGQSKIGAFPG